MMGAHKNDTWSFFTTEVFLVGYFECPNTSSEVSSL